MVEQELAGRRLAVPSSAAGFLVIRFHAPWDVEVGDEPNVRPIDPHPKCVRRNDNVALALHKRILRFLPRGVVHPAVVKNARDLGAAERFRDGLDSFSGRAINDAGLVFFYQGVQPPIFFSFGCDRRNQEPQIWPGKPGDEFARLAQCEVSENVATHLWRRRSGERRHLRAAKRFKDLAEPKIIRPEIVSPH